MSSAIEARLLAGDSSGKVKISQVAGKPAPKEMLVDLVRLEREYFVRRPDLSCPNQMVSFGTSGHRGSSLDGTFTEAHFGYHASHLRLPASARYRRSWYKLKKTRFLAKIFPDQVKG
jgi:hypothetical protein